MKVKFTPAAQREYLAILARLRAENPKAARAFHTKVKKALSRLASFPASGRKIPEFPSLDYRELLLPPYRFFYRVADKDVFIVAVWHSAQLPTPP
jgi:plasmid stabilization system protein ParE